LQYCRQFWQYCERSAEDSPSPSPTPSIGHQSAHRSYS
jgi:hypothetical protein